MTYTTTKITPQNPICSGFGAATTAAEVIRGVDLHRKTAIVTGGYSGIGLETTRALLSAGANVVVPSRDLSKAKGVLAGMPGVVVETLDLMKTPEQGAATSVWCATSPRLEGLGGVYCEDCNIAVPVPGDSKELRGVRPWAMSPSFADELWHLSEQLTGVYLPN